MELIFKLLFLLFWDNVKSERELMRMLPERLDYLWFLGFGLDDEIPDRSEADGIYPRERFTYEEARDVYVCPAGQTLHPRHFNERRQAYEYATRCHRSLQIQPLVVGSKPATLSVGWT